jgi:hypothetical protein
MSHLQILPDVYNRVDPLVERFLDMRERLRWQLQVGGERCLLYQYPWTGTFSPYYDSATSTVRISNDDLVGYGTPYVGGYLGPFEIFVSFMTAASPVTTQYTGEGVRQTFSSTNWMLWEPLLSNRDFIVRRNNLRYWVTGVDVSKWRHHILHQVFTSTLVETNNIIYKVPLTPGTSLNGLTTSIGSPILEGSTSAAGGIYNAGLATNKTGLIVPPVPPLPENATTVPVGITPVTISEDPY